MTRTLAGAIGLTRAWTRLYTSPLDPVLRDARRAEIESDLWESHEDGRRSGWSATGIALHILARCLMGVRNDLLWCLEHRRAQRKPLLRMALITAAAAVFLALFWVMNVLQRTPLPPVPRSMVFVSGPAPPPPPPPPPPAGTVVGDDGRVIPPPRAPSR